MEHRLDGHYGYRRLIAASLPLLVGMEGIWYSAPIAELLALLLGTALLFVFNRRYL